MRTSHITTFAFAMMTAGLVLADDPKDPAYPNPPIQNQIQPVQTMPNHSTMRRARPARRAADGP